MKTELEKKFKKLGGALCIFSIVNQTIYLLTKVDSFFIVGSILLNLGVALWVVS